jgi:hypothetical protein
LIEHELRSIGSDVNSHFSELWRFDTMRIGSKSRARVYDAGQQSDLAREADLSEPTVWAVIHGRRVSAATALKVVRYWVAVLN